MSFERYSGLLRVYRANVEYFISEKIEVKQQRSTKLGYETF